MIKRIIRFPNQYDAQKINIVIDNTETRASNIICSNEFYTPNGISSVSSYGGEIQIRTTDLMSIHEEANNWIISHVHDIIESGFYTVVIKTGDSVVLVILLYFMEHFLLKKPEPKIYVEFKTSGNERVINSINMVFLWVSIHFLVTKDLILQK